MGVRGTAWLICAIALLFVVTSHGLSYAQPSKQEEPVTRLERFTLAKGAVKVREYYEIGRVKGEYGSAATFEVARAFTPGQKDFVYALRIQTTESGRIERERIGVLDADEVAGLVTALPQILKMAQQLGKVQEPSTTTEIDFKGGSLRVTAFVKGGKSGMAIQAGEIGAVTAFFTLSDGPFDQDSLRDTSARCP